MPEAEAGEHQQHCCADERGECGNCGDLAHLPERVPVEQQTAQGLTLEHRRDLTGQRGVLRVGLCELGQLRVIVEDPSLKANVTFSTNTGYAILRIAPEVVAGELAAKRKEWDAATMHLERAVRYEDALVYQEPPDWHMPVRLNLGAVLLEAGRADEAEAVFWEDLRKNPGTGWALAGLLQALQAQKKDADAAQIRQRLDKAWKDADVKLTTARIGS